MQGVREIIAQARRAKCPDVHQLYVALVKAVAATMSPSDARFDGACAIRLDVDLVSAALPLADRIQVRRSPSGLLTKACAAGTFCSERCLLGVWSLSKYTGWYWHRCMLLARQPFCWCVVAVKHSVASFSGGNAGLAT